jgi:hypothetical protein
MLLKIATASLACAFLLAGCSKSSETTTNNNANSSAAVATSRPGPDNSEISTTTDANGVKTETRTFKNNPHISKIVVTTKNGVKTTRVYSRNGEEKELSNSQSQNALEETGDAIANSAGFVASKTVEGAEKAKDVGSEAAEKTKDTAKAVGDKTVSGAKTVTAKTVEGAKKAGDKTTEAAKKTGKAVKKVLP